MGAIVKRELLKLAIYKVVRVAMRVVFCVFPIQKKLFFSSFTGKCYADNPKYISEKLYELYPEYMQVWVKYSGCEFETPDYVKIVESNSLRMIYELETSKIWVDSHIKHVWMPKRRKQYYVETWHGGIPLKKIEKDIENQLSSWEIITEKYNVKLADLFISNSSFTTEMYRRAFWGYQGEIMECGYPRNDCFFSDTSVFKDKIKRKYHIASNVNILLYAPTFRGIGEEEKDTNINIYKFDFQKAVESLERATGQSWCFILRLHPVLKQFSNKMMSDCDFFIDATDYDDMQELILASDLFITDYSSAIIDFALLNRVGILYTPDLDDYVKERGLYFNLQELPFPMVRTESALLNFLSNIDHFDLSNYQNELDDFFENIGMIKTNNASEAVCHRINEIMQK